MSDELKMSLMSMNIFEEKKAQLKQIFPEAFTENKVDFERLKQVLGEHIETGRERYGMTWAGKSNCFKIIQEPSVATLKPCREESVNFDTSENLFIEGDNLEVLKLLQKSYYGKVKMIYIDPPYNTGNEFIYPDNFSESLDTYLKYTGQKDTEGKKFSTNVETDGRFHSKWMNMMYPRLYLARNLLREDGAIFISIDDHEVSNLRKLCDEIYGEENFLAQFVWKRRTSSSLAQNFVSTDHEYVLAYHKGAFSGFKGNDKTFENYTNTNNDPKGPWMLDNLTVGMTKDQRPNQFYDLVDPNTQKIYKANPNRVWCYIKSSMEKLVNEGRIYFPEDTNKKPMLVRYKFNLKSDVDPVSTWISTPKEKETNENKCTLTSGLNSEGTKTIQELFDFKVMDYPKPLTLIENLIKQVCITESDIVLDFFSGSCTTAHAALNSSIWNQAQYRFIMVQLPESTNIESEALKAGYRTISDIAKERIRRVINKLEEKCHDRKKYNLGFKVLKLSLSNFKTWETGHTEDVIGSLQMFADHIDHNSKPEDILYEILLKSGFELTTKVEKVNIEGKEVFSIEDGAMIIFLGDEVTKELTYAIAEKTPSRFVCLDHSFHNNDSLKTNTVQLMKSRNVEFRTV